MDAENDVVRGAACRLAIQRIVRLDVRDYEEVPATILTPDWQPGLDGVHTINAAAGLTVIDVRRRRWNTRLSRRDTRQAPQESRSPPP
jgi:hypothetical protein